MSVRDDRAIIHSFETGWGRRVGLVLGAVLAVALVAWALARGFHAAQIKRSARALEDPRAAPTLPAR